MDSNDARHVLVLTITQQCVVRQAAADYVQFAIWEIQDMYLNEKSAVRSQDAVADLDKIAKMVRLADDVTAGMAAFATGASRTAKTEAYYLDREQMDFIQEVLETWSANFSKVKDDYILVRMKEVLPKINAVVTESKKYTYTKDEIMKIVRGG